MESRGGGESIRPEQGERDTGRDGSEKAKALSAGSCIPNNWLMLSKATQGQPRGDGVAPWGDIIERDSSTHGSTPWGWGSFPFRSSVHHGKTSSWTVKKLFKDRGSGGCRPPANDNYDSNCVVSTHRA